MQALTSDEAKLSLSLSGSNSNLKLGERTGKVVEVSEAMDPSRTGQLVDVPFNINSERPSKV